jgi:toxin-antitoxin system PIN domain toxin
MARAALLDVNVLVALFTPEHVHHDAAHDWFDDHGAAGWASCTLTENGFVRIVSQLPRGDASMRPETAIDHFRRFRQGKSHRFWPVDVSLSDASLFRQSFIRGPQQVTDVCLLGLAVRHGGALVTFDGSIPLKSVIGATRDHLHVIAGG